MSMFEHVSLLALQQALGESGGTIVRLLGDHFGDHGQRLERALTASGDRAWRTLEVALAGPSWWQSCKSLLSPREEAGLARHVQAFLDTVPPAQLPGDPAAFRKTCLAEIRAARKAGLVPGDRARGDALAEQARAFAGYGDQTRRLADQKRRLDGVAGLLRSHGYESLAVYVSLRPGGGEPLLAQASRYFFRRAVEQDDKLADGLTLDRLEQVSTGQQQGFDGLREALDGHGQRLEGLLGGLQTAVLETKEAAVETRDDVRAMRDKLDEQDQQLRKMASMLGQLLEQRQTPAAPAAGRATPAPAVPAAAVTTPAPAPAVPAEGWDDVRRLLAKCRTMGEPARPELAQAIDEFQQTARRYETTRRTYLDLQQSQVGESLPVYPEVPVAEVVEVPVAKPAMKHRLISSIFLPQAEPVAEAKPAEETPPAETPPKRHRLVSKLFDPPPKPE